MWILIISTLCNEWWTTDIIIIIGCLIKNTKVLSTKYENHTLIDIWQIQYGKYTFLKALRLLKLDV